MLKNYLTVARRNLFKNARYTIINVFGLAVALACCILAYLNHDYAYGYDEFHENAQEIYRLSSTQDNQGYTTQWGITPRPLGPALARDVAGLDQVVRLSETDVVMRHGDRVFNQELTYVDLGFFEMFTFPFKYGDASALRDPNQVILTSPIATKYFGETNPLGQEITLRYGNEELRAYTVGGVLEPIPANSSIQMQVVSPYQTVLDVFGRSNEAWAGWGHVTFIQTQDHELAMTLTDRMQPYVDQQNLAMPDFQMNAFIVTPFSEMFLTSQEVRWYYLTTAMHPAAIVAPSILAIMILLMACFNFMNTSIAYAGKRLKEIGVRKVIGGYRKQLIIQFLAESLFVCVLAFVIALVLAEVLVPAYSNLWPEMDLQLIYAENLPLFGFLIALLFSTALLAGGYPAFYISAFNPVAILRGQQKFGGTNWFTRTFLALQMTMAVMLIIASFAFTKNAHYQDSLDLGYSTDTVIMVGLPEANDYEPLRNMLAQNPLIENIAGSRSHVSWSWFGGQARKDGEENTQRIDQYLLGENYLETLGIRVIAGEGFDADREADALSSVLVNERLVDAFGFEDPVGQVLVVDSVEYNIAGVVQDMYSRGVWGEMEPTVIRYSPEELYRYLSIQTSSDNLLAAYNVLETAWTQLHPDLPFEPRYQDEVLAEAKMINQNIQTVFLSNSIIAILMAITGLFALVSLNIAKRTKEIGIRKVLGASVGHISTLINKEFVILLCIASLLAAGGSIFSIQALMDSIWSYNSGVGILPLALGTISIFVISLMTVGGQVYKVATSNPIKALRYE